MSTSIADWPTLARQLADELARAGKLTDPAWRRAVCAIPRHELVPTYHYQDRNGRWHEADTSTDAGQHDWLAQVYANTVLITALAEDTTGNRVLSSASQPGLVTRMLEALDVTGGQRVLEIGTGTGYNAALLSHRLGARNVFSVDIEPHLVTLARDRLAHLGYRPTLVVGDGANGLPEPAPFDRIIATCAVPRIPWPWVTQTTLGGVILADLKTAHAAGSLIRLTRTDPDRAEGRFDPTYAAFMDLRQEAGHNPNAHRWHARDDRDVAHTTTTVDPRTPWTNLVVWFFAALHLGPAISVGYAGTDPRHAPSAVTISTSDGSWTEITLDAVDGTHDVTEGGPRQLWRIVEDAHHLWTDLGEPGWDRLGLTVTPERQTVWLDHPDSDHTWHLSARAGSP